MAFPTDPYGNPIPANPGAKRVTDSDGATYPIRSNLSLGNIAVTDSPETDSTILTGGGGADFTVAGLAMAEAADANAQRTLLGITDIGDMRSYAISRAKSLCGFTGTMPRVWPGTMFGPIGAAGAHNWLTKQGPGTCSRITSGVDAGKVDVSATAGGGYVLLGRAEAPSVVDRLVSDVIGTRWYAFWVAKANTAADATSDMNFGMQGADSTYTEFVCLGVNGAVSTTKFSLHRFSTISTLSTVSVDTGWHVFEMWSNPDTDSNAVFGCVDGESPIKLDNITAFGQPAGPWIHVYAGGANQSMRFSEQFVILDQ